MFQKGYSSTWNIPPQTLNITPVENLLKNKELAKSLMLPSETSSLKQLQEVFGYINFQLVNESILAFKHRAFRLITSLTEFSSEKARLSEEVTLPSLTLGGRYLQVI